MPVDLSFFRYEIICIFWWFDEFQKWCKWYGGLERYFGDSLIANTVKVMPEWIWPFSSSKELLVEWFFSHSSWRNCWKREKREAGTNNRQEKRWKHSKFKSYCLVVGGLHEYKLFFNVNLFYHFYFQAQLVGGYEVIPSAIFWMSRRHGRLPLFVKPQLTGLVE